MTREEWLEAIRDKTPVIATVFSGMDRLELSCECMVDCRRFRRYGLDYRSALCRQGNSDYWIRIENIRRTT